MVLSLAGEDRGRVRVVVLPITHSEPRSPTDGVELPWETKRRLGLDEGRSWVVVSEANRFLWPGPDVRKVPGQDSASYGILPPGLFRIVRDRFLARVRAAGGSVAERSE